MLWKKMLRDMRSNFSQFLSIFILSLIAMWCFTGFQANVIGGNLAREQFNEDTNFADGWIYGSSFDKDDLEATENIDAVTDAQLRTEVLGKAEEKYNTAEIYCYFQDTSEVIRPYTIEGSDYDPNDTDGVWLFYRFADVWELNIGDKFTVNVMGCDIEKTIRGFVATPEYEYAVASTDTDTDYHNIGFAYFSYDSMPEEMRIFNEIVFTSESSIKDIESDISKALEENYAYIGDRTFIRGYQQLSDELSQHDTFSYIYSFVFVAIALLVIMTTMKRMIAHQRTQIGTLNALGMKKRKIITHYLSFSFILSLLGCALGIILGLKTFGRIMVDMFAGEYYSVPNWEVGFDYKSFVVAGLIILVCTADAYLSCRSILKIHPSEALRPAAAPGAKKCIFEKLPFWNKLSFNSRYNLRDISRSKLRAFMGIFGTCVGMLLILLGLGANDTLSYIENWNFEELQNYEYQIIFNSGTDAQQADELSDDYGGELISTESISIASNAHPTSDEIVSCSLVVNEGKNMYCVTDNDLNVKSVEKGKVALTKNQAAAVGLDEGDTVYWKTNDSNEWYSSEIAFISRNPSVMGITMLREDYEELGFEFSPSMLVTSDEPVGAEDNSCVAAVHNVSDLRAAFEETMAIMNVLVYLMIFFSILMIVIVLYNSGNLSFNEREKEFATLKVMGFRSSKIRKLISSQNLWLSVIGAIVGIPFGKTVLQAMMDSNGDNVDWPCYISPVTYVISGVFVVLVAVAVGFMFSKRIKRIDMVEILKGME